MNTDYAALAGRIRQSLLDIVRVVNRAEMLLDKAQSSGDDDFLDGVALNLHGFYTGIEQIFEDIARSVEKSVPASSEWHRDLLLQMSSKVESVRPPVISQETRYCMDEYRGFRHIVRNVYTFNMRPSLLKELTERLRNCFQNVERDLDAFATYLEQLSQESDDT